MAVSNPTMSGTSGRSLSPQTSMTLTVNQEDARRMLEASHALNKRLVALQQERDEEITSPDKRKDEHKQQGSPNAADVPKRVVSTSENGSVASDHDYQVEGTIHPLVVEAASSCDNALVQSFLASLSELHDYEIRVCLLLFLDMGKSTKLMKAFRTLSLSMYKEDPEPLTLQTDGSVSLFKCFLTAISLCIHHQPPKTEIADSSSCDTLEQPHKARKETDQSSPSSSNSAESKSNKTTSAGADAERLPCASPSFDSGMDTGNRINLPDEIINEISEIAAFASERLLDYFRKHKQDETATTVTFEEFGAWYNSGGCSIAPWLELLDLSKWESAGAITTHAEEPNDEVPSSTTQAATDQNPQKPEATQAHSDKDGSSPVNFFMSGNNAEQANGQPRPIVSFDFTGAMSSTEGSVVKNHSPFCINITEENLHMLQNLVNRTGIASRRPQQVSDVLLRHSSKIRIGDKDVLVLHRQNFGRCIRDLVSPEAYRRFSKAEMEDFSMYFTDFFSCLEHEKNGLGKDQVNVKELAVAFSFLCAGNKSAKLATGFELLDEERTGHLSMQQLTQYVRSYLAMLVGISLLSAIPGEKSALSSEKRQAMNTAVDSGARWTLGHVQKHFEEAGENDKQSVTFEDFAGWYTVGGYKVAPWLELLDLSKLMALLGDGDMNYASARMPPPSTGNRLRQTTRSAKVSSSEMLFTFPLANRRSLMVLREDAIYVRSVVERLALLPLSASDLWNDLFKGAKAQPAVLDVPNRKRGTGKSMDVDSETFVRCMAGVIESISTSGRKRPSAKNPKISPEAKETLTNFFYSFDLQQVDRVALNELMGGLCLLCGGKKSTKLAFAFGLFDGRRLKKSKKKDPVDSLKGEELFLFLRSFLIVMFSCCQQSMDLSAEQVGRYISESAHTVAQDVMHYQWTTRKKDRVDFDEFGEWYNEGGFETAPWLELLDLAKWVLADDLDAVQSRTVPQATMPSDGGTKKTPSWASQGNGIPPPPPEDQLDASSFFADNTLMQMDSLDEMDMMLFQQPSQDKENEGFAGNRVAMQISPRNQSSSRPNSSLKFHLVTYDEHGGYMLSVSQRRVAHLRSILLESGLCQVGAEDASRIILGHSTSDNSKKGSRSTSSAVDLILTKDGFDAAMRQVVSHGRGKANLTIETQRALSELLAWIFNTFDRHSTGKAQAVEVACGLMVLCAGKKSDKLEYGFEVLDKNRDGKLSRREMSNYLKSFLAVLLSVASAACLESDPAEDVITFVKGGTCERGPGAITRASDRGADWATGQAFDAALKAGDQSDVMSFDSFAEWYTTVGYTSIPWLELLDLSKWVLT